MQTFITRFAPSPTGWLHLGHAYSALLTAQTAAAQNGQCLLRIEDIDQGRSRPHFVEGILEDLAWLGLTWPNPVWRQSERFAFYEAALDDLRARGLVYPCWATRGEIDRAISDFPRWPRDPDGAPVYPGLYRDIPEARRKELMWEGRPYAWRLDMARATAEAGTLTFTEHDKDGNAQTLPVDAARFGDVVLARKDTPTSYHLSVVVDDAAQNITHIIRGRDLRPAAHVHRLLQALLGLPAPAYTHHDLLRNPRGGKLSKQAKDMGFRAFRQAGWEASDLIARLPPPVGTGTFETPDF